MQQSITKKVFNCSFAALLLVSTFSTYATQNQDSGTINFYGAVVHPTCTNDITDREIKLHCMNDNTESSISNIDLNSMTKKGSWNVINDGRNEYSYNWINEEKQLRMLTVKYI